VQTLSWCLEQGVEGSASIGVKCHLRVQTGLERGHRSPACPAVQVCLPHCMDLSTVAQLRQSLTAVGDEVFAMLMN